jgi:TPP-dependent pyruvate/acetoin dehydrogenase alpha subunit
MPGLEKLDKKDLLEMFHWLKLVRAFEERVSRLYRQGKILGGVYSGIGQEAVIVGACYPLKEGDAIFPLHRDLGAFLIRGVEPKVLMAQLMGKATGLSKGKDSYLHASSPEHGVFGSTSMLGSSMPVAAGAALAFKLQGRDNVAVSFFGEGASNRGDFHEGLNMAGVWKLPVIYVCENNQYAYSTPMESQMAITDVADRAASYGFPGVVVSGNDLNAVYRAVRKAIDQARVGEGPTLIECKTYRYHGHSEHDKATYREEMELAEWKVKDPLVRFQSFLEELGILTEDWLGQTEKKISTALDEAVTFAEDSPYPEGHEALEDVFTPTDEEGER